MGWPVCRQVKITSRHRFQIDRQGSIEGALFYGPDTREITAISDTYEYRGAPDTPQKVLLKKAIFHSLANLLSALRLMLSN